MAARVRSVGAGALYHDDIEGRNASVRYQDFRQSRRRDLDADTYHSQPRSFGTRSRFSQPRFETPSGPPVSRMVKWYSLEKGFGFIEL